MVATLAEYVEEVGRLRGSVVCPGFDKPELWFRGHRNAAWDLDPTLLRDRRPPTLSVQDYETSLCEQFAARAPALARGSFRKDLTQRVTMQHHGVPTRLLDWTRSAMAGLYFAVRKFKSREDGVVHVLNANGLSIVSSRSPALQVILDDGAPNQGGAALASSLPFPIVPAYANRRVAAQQGRFTVHPLTGGGFAAAEQQWKATPSAASWLLARVDVPSAAKEPLFWELQAAGVTEAALFPDLDALGRELRSELTQGETDPF